LAPDAAMLARHARMRQGDRAFTRTPDRHRRFAELDLMAEEHAADDDQARTGPGLLRRGRIQHRCAISLEILVLVQGPDSQQSPHCSVIESHMVRERLPVARRCQGEPDILPSCPCTTPLPCARSY